MHNGVDPLVAALQTTTRDLMTLALQSLDGAERGLTLAHLRLLLVVSERRHSTCAELAPRLGISASSITRQADRLVQSGHLTRQPDPDNRRAVLLEPTDRGRRAVEDVLARRAAVFEQITTDLPPALRRSLTQGLAALHLNYERLRDVERDLVTSTGG